MPAYFNLSLQFDRSDIYPGFVKDFYEALEQAGLKFLSGAGREKEDSREKITGWNQEKLEQDFKLGFTEHVSHDYKQVLYAFREYSQVRGFWLNQYPEKGSFTYEIVIPEEDVLFYEGGDIFPAMDAENLLRLAKEIWDFPYIRTIQTGLEGDEAAVSLREINDGIPPKIRPFAILEEKNRCMEGKKIKIRPLDGRRKGWIYCDTSQISELYNMN